MACGGILTLYVEESPFWWAFSEVESGLKHSKMDVRVWGNTSNQTSQTFLEKNVRSWGDASNQTSSAQARAFLEEETSTEKLSPPDWLVGRHVVHFLN